MNAATRDPLALPMVSGFGQYATDKDGTRPDALGCITFHEVRELVDKPHELEKHTAQWLIPSTHQSRKGHDRNGVRPVIWADIDEPGRRTIRQTGDLLRELLGRTDFEVYASRSATKEKQKCRILVPLAEALTPDQWLVVSEVFRLKLEQHGVESDKASGILGQVLYLPNKGEFYDSDRLRGLPLFQPLVGWAQDIRQRREQIEREAEATRKAQEAARTRRDALTASRTTSGFQSAIEAFNAAYDVAEVLTRNGYDQRGDTFRHPASESGSFSATVRESAPGVRRVHTLSTNDKLNTGGGGGGAHDAFSAFCILEHGGDRDAALRAAGNQWLVIGGETWNKVRQREFMQQQNQSAGPVFADFAEFDPETGEQREPDPKLKAVSVFDVLTNPSPPPIYVWEGLIPQGTVTLFGAHGGTGKSTIGLMLAVAAALGRPLFGLPTKQCSTLFVSLEDGTNIIRHRLATICRAWSINPLELDGRLHILDGTENPELYTADNRGPGETTETYREVFARAEAIHAGLILVDNASDSFGGDEINRRQVRAFMRSLRQIAEHTGCALLLLAHVDKNTSRNKKPEGGEGYSGSTAWHNSARSRLFMTREDSGRIKLEHQKNNLGRKIEPILLTWEEGEPLPGLMGTQEAPDFSGLDARMRGRADDNAAAALLRLIAEFESREQFCGTALTARNNVFATLKAEPDFKALSLTREDVQRLVAQCQRAGWIEVLDYRTPDRKDRQRWTVTTKGREFSGLSAPSAPSALSYM